MSWCSSVRQLHHAEVRHGQSVAAPESTCVLRRQQSRFVPSKFLVSVCFRRMHSHVMRLLQIRRYKSGESDTHWCVLRSTVRQLVKRHQESLTDPNKCSLFVELVDAQQRGASAGGGSPGWRRENFCNYVVAVQLVCPSLQPYDVSLFLHRTVLEFRSRAFGCEWMSSKLPVPLDALRPTSLRAMLPAAAASSSSS